MAVSGVFVGATAPKGKIPGKIGKRTVIFEIITFLIQKHFKTATVTVILTKLIQMTF